MSNVGRPIDAADAAQGLCLYAAPTQGVGGACRVPATVHVLGKAMYRGEEAVLTLPTCDEHLGLARASLNEIMKEHPFEEACAGVEVYWATDLNRCFGITEELEGLRGHEDVQD